MSKPPKPLAVTPTNIRRVLKAAGFTESVRMFKDRNRYAWQTTKGFRIEPFHDAHTGEEFLSVVCVDDWPAAKEQRERYRETLSQRFHIEVKPWRSPMAPGDYIVETWAILPLDTAPAEDVSR